MEGAAQPRTKSAPRSRATPQFRIESAFQADARTLQVRWVSTWDAAPGMGWDGLAREAALVRLARCSAAHSALTQPVPTAQEDKRLSAETRVSQLTRELESARSELLAAQRLLEGRGSVLSPALGALDRGLEQSRELGVAVGEAREAAPTEWGLLRMVLAGDDGAPGTGSLAALEKLRWSLTSRVRGTTLLKLDDAGRVVLHEDRLDLSRQPGGPAAGSSSGDDEEPSYVAGSQSDLFAWCCAHRPASSNRLGYVFGVVSTLLWLSFRTEEGVDDEARVALADRREFDTLLAGVLASLVFLTGLAAVGTVSWLAFAAPHLPAQVQAFVGEPGTQATLNALKSLDVGRLLRGRSLFDAGEFGGPLD